MEYIPFEIKVLGSHLERIQKMSKSLQHIGGPHYKILRLQEARVKSNF